MPLLKILHVASFTGNIGDNANHVGFVRQLKSNIDKDFEFTKFEIREVYWGRKSFDSDFVDLANSHDLVVVGGGNYFELWVENSATGCSFDIDLDLLSLIKTPLVFNALGVDPAQGASSLALDKFRKFLDVVISNDHMLLSCRNDGSIKALQQIVGEQYASEFYHVPDAGFFTEVDDYDHPEIMLDKKNVVFQVAGDMLEDRFPNSSSECISYDDFVKGLSNVAVRLCEMGSNIILVPHIYSDLRVISDLISVLPDDLRRRYIKVAPYLTGNLGQSYIFDLYKKSDLVLGMRFHANVCAIGLGTPCVGLVNYRQISELYEELNLTRNAVHVNKTGFDQNLIDLAEKILSTNEGHTRLDLKPWEQKIKRFHAAIDRLLV